MNKILKWGLVCLTAVAAFYLLGYVLFCYVGSCDSFEWSDTAAIAAAMTLKKSANAYGMPTKTQHVIWKNGGVLESTTLAAQSGLSETQICILRGDFAADSRFDSEGQEGKMLRYVGTAGFNTKLLALCGHADKIAGTLVAYDYGWAGQFSDCPCDTKNPETCCIIAVVRNA